MLLENRDRVVTKDEIIERIWNGRIVSEAALSSRIKAVRQAIGDDGAPKPASEQSAAGAFASSPR